MTPIDDEPTELRELHTPTAAIHDLYPQPLFEAGYTTGERGLSDVNSFSGAPKVAVSGQCQDPLDLLHRYHDSSLSKTDINAFDLLIIIPQNVGHGIRKQ